MKVSVNEKLEIQIDLATLVHDYLDAEQKQELIRILAWSEDVLIRAAELIREEYAGPGYNAAIHDARLKLVDHLPQLAKDVIFQLLREVKHAKDLQSRAEKWAWNLYHSWPDESWQLRPRLPDWSVPPNPADAEVEERLRAKP